MRRLNSPTGTGPHGNTATTGRRGKKPATKMFFRNSVKTFSGWNDQQLPGKRKKDRQPQRDPGSGRRGSYEIDAVFFTLALAVYNLATSGIEFKSDLLDLETRVLNAGLRLAPAK
jgi:hypothetical protein